MSKSKWLLLVAILFALLVFFYFDLGSYIEVGFFRGLYQNSPWLSASVFFLLYVLAAALSIPAAALLTIIGGMIFGLSVGVLLASFASTIGATLAFLVARNLIHDWVQDKLGKRLEAINKGVAKEGALYLFSLRLIPVFPFWVINLALALTPIKTWTFYWISQIGMFPATVVYVNAGAQLGAVDNFSLHGIMTPGLIVAFVLLGLLPFAAKFLFRVASRMKKGEGNI